MSFVPTTLILGKEIFWNKRKKVRSQISSSSRAARQVTIVKEALIQALFLVWYKMCKKNPWRQSLKHLSAKLSRGTGAGSTSSISMVNTAVSHEHSVNVVKIPMFGLLQHSLHHKCPEHHYFVHTHAAKCRVAFLNKIARFIHC